MAAVHDLIAGMHGVILPFAGTTAPGGFLLCDGSAVSASTYPALFATIGTRYNTGGETAGMFRVPDLRGRVIAGVDNMGGAAANRLTSSGSGVSGATLGASGGGENHTLTSAQMPAHNHGVNDPAHGHGVNDPTHAHSVYDPGHSHSYTVHTIAYGLTGGGAFPLDNTAQTTSTGGAVTGIGIYGAYSGISIAAAGTGISIQNAGSGSAHPNVQPTMVLNYVIKT